MGTLFRRAWPFATVGGISILLVGFFISRLTQDRYLRQSHDRLEREAAVLGQIAVKFFELNDSRLWHQQVREWSRVLDVRVTVADSAGMVITDTDWPEDSLEALSRRTPASLEDEDSAGERWAIGYSPVWHAELLYATQVIQSEGHTLGLLRLALPLSSLEQQQREVRNFFLSILVIAGLLLVALSAWVTHTIRKPIAQLAQTAARFSKGDWEARVPIDPYRSSDEFSELAHDFNRMAVEVQSRYVQSRRERDQLQAVLSNMSDGVLAVDAQGRVRLVNEAFRRFFRPVLAEPEGHPHTDAFRDRGLNELVEKLLSGEAQESEELEVLSPRRRVLVVRPAVIEAASGEDVRGVLVARDVTARRQIDQIRRDFVANVSHELRTPLTSILGYLAALRDSSHLEPPASTFVDTIERNADRMNRIVGDLLELSRIEAPGFRPNLSTFSLSGLVEEIRVSMAQTLASHQQELCISIDPGADQCTADRDAVGRIVINLLDNASKYSPDGQTIVLTVTRSGPDLVITIADEGIGVPESDRARLFERFFRVERGRSQGMGGTGLGLSIVKHLADAHGGSVHYEPNLPIGSRLIVRIPQEWKE